MDEYKDAYYFLLNRINNFAGTIVSKMSDLIAELQEIQEAAEEVFVSQGEAPAPRPE
ncbi:MAG: hypothetical protein FWD39_03980 [Clostridiales bacterium]|nr:hypothetical protein [Clostridiales bacterium]